jgi:hypothetical protein
MQNYALATNELSEFQSIEKIAVDEWNLNDFNLNLNEWNFQAKDFNSPLLGKCL